MIKKRQKDILILAVFAGETMLRSGAEIYRVEDTVTRICRACGIEFVDVFAMPTGIFVTLDNGEEDDDDTFTYIRRVKKIETDLNKISKINDFSRTFSSTDMTVEEGMEVLKEINKETGYPWPVRSLASGLVTACFCVLFGGGGIDFCIAAIAGVFCHALSWILERYSVNFFIRGFCCTALAAFFAMAAATGIPAASYAPIIAGSIMLFVPGVALTNSIRDFLSGDMLAGLSRLTEVVLTGVSLAAGAGMILASWHIIGGIL